MYSIAFSIAVVVEISTFTNSRMIGSLINLIYMKEDLEKNGGYKIHFH